MEVGWVAFYLNIKIALGSLTKTIGKVGDEEKYLSLDFTKLQIVSVLFLNRFCI